jgi:type II pantothenate kinase
MLVQTLLQRELHSMVEFDATCIGVQFLLEKQGIQLDSFVLTNAGTGTSIHFVDPQRHFRIGGTGVGGGTMLGLSFLLTGVSDFTEIVQRSAQGNRDRIDLKVSHIYEGAIPPISGDLTASNFGHVLHYPDDRVITDMLASVIGLVGETVSTTSVLAAGHHGISSIVYIGSSFIGNDLLKQVVAQYTELRGATPLFVEDGEYSGAIGALLSLDTIINKKGDSE